MCLFENIIIQCYSSKIQFHWEQQFYSDFFPHHFEHIISKSSGFCFLLRSPLPVSLLPHVRSFILFSLTVCCAPLCLFLQFCTRVLDVSLPQSYLFPVLCFLIQMICVVHQSCNIFMCNTFYISPCLPIILFPIPSFWFHNQNLLHFGCFSSFHVFYLFLICLFLLNFEFQFS